VPARRVLTLVATVLMLLAGCGAGGGSKPPGPAPLSLEFNAADVLFVQLLIPHHREGVEIAGLGAAKAANPDVRVLAGAIVATQQDEATRMAGWLQAWQQPAASAASAASAAPQTPAKQIAALGKATGKDFDREFLTLLIAHQNEAIELAKTESQGGRNLNALTFAKQIQQSREAEIKEMRGYLTTP
jgi:uncharacterized protein (DUF305 family)